MAEEKDIREAKILKSILSVANVYLMRTKFVSNVEGGHPGGTQTDAEKYLSTVFVYEIYQGTYTYNKQDMRQQVIQKKKTSGSLYMNCNRALNFENFSQMESKGMAKKDVSLMDVVSLWVCIYVCIYV